MRAIAAYVNRSEGIGSRRDWPRSSRCANSSDRRLLHSRDTVHERGRSHFSAQVVPGYTALSAVPRRGFAARPLLMGYVELPPYHILHLSCETSECRALARSLPR